MKSNDKKKCQTIMSAQKTETGTMVGHFLFYKHCFRNRSGKLIFYITPLYALTAKFHDSIARSIENDGAIAFHPYGSRST